MGYSIVPAAILALLRMRRIDPDFYPFIICTWIATANEILSVVLQRHGLHTSVNNNVYVLLESVLIVAVLQKFGAFGRRYMYFVTLSGLSILWFTENIITGELHLIHSGFRLSYAILVVILSTQVACRLILSEKQVLLRSAEFCLVLAFILYYTYKILVEIFWLYGLNASPEFLDNVYFIHAWINLICNIIFLISIAWMPARRPYTMPY